MDGHGERIDRVRAGDPVAWNELVGRHLGTVHAICRAFGLDRVAAADVNQAVWLRLAEHLPRIRTPDAIGGWIAATARREGLDPARDSQRSAWIAGGLSVRLGDGTDEVHVAEGLALGRAFARLGATAQRLVRLSAARPHPADDVIAAALGMSAADVPAACTRARERLIHLVRTDAQPGGPANVDLALERILASGDSVPSSWWTAADAAFSWLCIDAELAETVYDSTVSGPDGRDVMGLHRPGGGRRSLRFSAGSRQVDLVIDVTDGGASSEVVLRGRVDAADAPDVVARWPGGSSPIPVGPDGAFHLGDLPLGPLCVEVDGRPAAHRGAPTTVPGSHTTGQATDEGFKTGWIFP